MTKLKIFNQINSLPNRNEAMKNLNTLVDRYGFAYTENFIREHLDDDADCNVGFYFKIFLKLKARKKLKEEFGMDLNISSVSRMLKSVKEEKNMLVREQRYDKAQKLLDKERLLSFLINV